MTRIVIPDPSAIVKPTTRAFLDEHRDDLHRHLSKMLEVLDGEVDRLEGAWAPELQQRYANQPEPWQKMALGRLGVLLAEGRSLDDAKAQVDVELKSLTTFLGVY